MNTVLCREEIGSAIRQIGAMKNLCDDFKQYDNRFGIISVELGRIERKLQFALEDAIDHIYTKAGRD